MKATSQIQSAVGNLHEKDYADYLARMHMRFTANVNAEVPVFRVGYDFWAMYLGSLPESERQYHNCNCCRHFIQRYGDLVIVAEDGCLESAFWSVEDAPDLYKPVISGMMALLAGTPIAEPFLSEEPVLGNPVTGVWTHLNLPNPVPYKRTSLTAGQRVAELKENYRTVRFALDEFPEGLLEKAVTLLKADQMYRGDKVLGPAEWLLNMQRLVRKHPGQRGLNLLWSEVALAPNGFCHPRSSMIATLLEDLAKGKTVEQAAASFKAKMAPDLYQRPQAAPKNGTIDQAEKLFETMGLALSLRRRPARVEELNALWRPMDTGVKIGALFGSLRQVPLATSEVLQRGSITFDRFVATVLPEVASIQVQVPSSAAFGSFVTAVDQSAPLLFKWANPFSWYTYLKAMPAVMWNLKAASWANCTAIALHPSVWNGAEQGSTGAMFVLEGARDKAGESLAVFPEDVRSELHGVRSVIEAYSKTHTLQQVLQGSASGLLCWPQREINYSVRVTLKNGTCHQYLVDRWV